MDQFDALIIELADPLNFFLFSIAFLGTIIKVWFMPSYVQYSYAFFRKLKLVEHPKDFQNQEDDTLAVSRAHFWDALDYRGVYRPVPSLLRKEITENVRRKRGLDEESTSVDPPSNFFQRLQNRLKGDSEDIRMERSAINRKISFPSALKKSVSNRSIEGHKAPDIEYKAYKVFHSARRSAGLIFILIFLWLQMKTLGNTVGGWSIFGDSFANAALIIFTGGLFHLMFYLDNWINKASNQIEKEKRRRKIFNYSIVAGGIFLAMVITTSTLHFWRVQPFTVLIFFTITILSSAIAFILYTISGYPRINNPELSRMDRIQENDQFSDNGICSIIHSNFSHFICRLQLVRGCRSV